MSRTRKIIYALLLIAILVAMGFKLGQWQEVKKNQKTEKNSIKLITNNSSTSSSTAVAETSTSALSTSSSTAPAVSNDEFSSWQNFTNSKYRYTFKYPENWKTSSNQTDYSVVVNEKNSTTFSVRTGDMSAIGFENYTNSKEENLLLAGEPVKAIYYDPPKSSEGDAFDATLLNHLIVLAFEKNSVQYVIMYSYGNSGDVNQFSSEFKKIISTFSWL
ncbi:MAG: hypothetical protein CEN91_252 [Candidatus Berkelbacteria bacterium Licking1014_85]|uniref:PsbP C-terminal domain-containing protein n=1 Tax=Candidatus Berkelbacteria bacterium Licking1014_85 TaxID=2017148 RepID=A0A554LKD9_9BACT|nr:MAG: hypothetical protein CEN91_252 [Candidatus Berkelbacteria bacterium Licking1014_85]